MTTRKNLWVRFGYLYLDPPRGAKWMVKGVIKQLLRVRTPPLGGCWYHFHIRLIIHMKNKNICPRCKDGATTAANALVVLPGNACKHQQKTVAFGEGIRLALSNGKNKNRVKYFTNLDFPHIPTLSTKIWPQFSKKKWAVGRKGFVFAISFVVVLSRCCSSGIRSC